MPESLERRVLVALVTESDPESTRGIGPILTAAIALHPEAIHLLYQPKPYPKNTEDNLHRLEKELRKDPDLRRIPVKIHPLDLPDLRRYEDLVKVLPSLLKAIQVEYPEYPRKTFYFLCGHPQVRMIMWLSLATFIVEGIPLEVDNPEPDTPVTPKTCKDRLREVDLDVIGYFRRAAEDHVRSRFAKLVLDLDIEQAHLAGKPLGLRKRKVKEGESEARTFSVLFLLAFYTRFGKDSVVAKSCLYSYVYRGYNLSNVPKAIQKINELATKLTGQELVKLVEPGKYQLSLDRSQISFRGDCVSFFRQKFGKPPELEEFPGLRF